MINEIVLRALQQYDQYVCQVLDSSTDTALYKFDGTNNKWEKLNIEGTFYLCKRTLVPFYCFVILNTTGGEPLEEKLSKDMMIQLQEPFLLYKRTGEVKGILFKEGQECHRLANIMGSLLKEISGLGPREGSSNSVKAGSASSVTTVSVGQHLHNSDPIPQTQVSTTNPAPNSIIRMLHSAAAKQSPASAASKLPDPIRSRPQTIATPQQQTPQQQSMHSGLHHGAIHNQVTPNSVSGAVGSQTSAASQNTKGAGHWSNKTTTISVDYLFKSLSNPGQLSPPRTSSPKQPQAPTHPISQTASIPPSRPTVSGAAMTLSEVEQQALAEASERLRQQLGINCGGDTNSSTSRAEVRAAPQQVARRSGVESYGVVGSSTNVSASSASRGGPYSTTVVSVDEDGEDEEGLVLTPNMMLEQSVGNAVTTNSSTAAASRLSRTLPHENSRGSVDVTEMALNRQQLRQALLTMVAEDDDFLTRIHEAYIRSLQQRLK